MRRDVLDEVRRGDRPARLKSLVVHGYFTSERVQRDVLHTQMFHDRFQGAADMPARRTP